MYTAPARIGRKKRQDGLAGCPEKGINKVSEKFLLFSKKGVDISRNVWYSNQRCERQAPRPAGVAQLVEQLICNQQVGGSSPSTSSILCLSHDKAFIILCTAFLKQDCFR